MLDDLLKATKESILDRLNSPILFSFGASWCAWNYKFIVILLSDNSVQETFRLIDDLAFPGAFPALNSAWMRGGLLPLLTSAAFVFGYPYPARFVYGFLRKQQVQQNRRRQEIDNETLLTREESRAVYAEVERQRQESEKAVDESNRQIRQLREANGKLEAQLREASSESEPSRAVKLEAERVVSELRAKLADAIDMRDRQQRLYERLATQSGSIEVLVDALTPEQRHLLDLVFRAGGNVNREALRTTSTLSADEFKRHVRGLAAMKLVEEAERTSINGEDRVRLLELGESAIAALQARPAKTPPPSPSPAR